MAINQYYIKRRWSYKSLQVLHTYLTWYHSEGGARSGDEARSGEVNEIRWCRQQSFLEISHGGEPKFSWNKNAGRRSGEDNWLIVKKIIDQNWKCFCNQNSRPRTWSNWDILGNWICMIYVMVFFVSMEIYSWFLEWSRDIRCSLVTLSWSLIEWWQCRSRWRKSTQSSKLV